MRKKFDWRWSDFFLFPKPSIIIPWDQMDKNLKESA